TSETSSGSWTDWIIRANTGEIVRRGRIDRYGNALTMRSTLVNDRAVFSSHGLTRTGGVLANDLEFTICLADRVESNRRVSTVGAGSRISTVSETGAC